MNDHVNTDLNNHLDGEEERERKAKEHAEEIKALAMAEVNDEILKRSSWFREGLAGEGLEEEDFATVAAHFLAVPNLSEGAQNLLFQDIGKIFYQQVIDYILPKKLEEAEDKVVNR